jgi:hypothetical protein
MAGGNEVVTRAGYGRHQHRLIDLICTHFCSSGIRRSARI